MTEDGIEIEEEHPDYAAILDTKTVEPVPLGANTPELIHFHRSQAAFSGILSPRTLRVQGKIHELTVTVLVDSWSSHNIIQPRIAKILHLPVVPLTPFSVMVGNGETIKCSGSCDSVPPILLDQLIDVPFFVWRFKGLIWCWDAVASINRSLLC